MRLVIQWLLMVVVILTATTFGTAKKLPRLSPIDPLKSNKVYVPSGYETFFYNQTLDHFNYKPESYATFQQRYIINSNWWGGANKNAPILAYLGAEEPIENDLTVGFLTENAPRFKALVVYLEHRFYGESNPLGSKGGPGSVEAMEESVKNKTIRGYFNSAQALADYAELLLHIKHKQLHAHNSPIIVIGGSYGGMLASWFRLKYPHIALGALASSAPILNLYDITPQDGFYSTVTKDFKEASENCYTTIKQSWDEVDRVASMPNGLVILSQKFKTCSPLNDAFELKDSLKNMYVHAALYGAPPVYPTTWICQGIDVASSNASTDILDRVFAGVVANSPTGTTCYINMRGSQTQTSIGWSWQACSEMLFPMGITTNASMFPTSPYDANEYIGNCIRTYGVQPRPHWASTYYGGQDIRMVLRKFGSNIIFSNGLRDPFSSGGVLEDISHDIVAVKTTNGSHCLDIQPSQETDPEWLVKQRKDEVKIISRWFKRYYRSLRLLKH